MSLRQDLKNPYITRKGHKIMVQLAFLLAQK